MRLAATTMLITIVFCFACHKKTLPVITERSSNHPMGNKDTTSLITDVADGKLLFNNRCGRCHGLPVTTQFTANRWDTLIASMAPRAQLNRQQEWNVLSYVKQNALVNIK